jgi:hypothetical protein
MGYLDWICQLKKRVAGAGIRVLELCDRYSRADQTFPKSILVQKEIPAFIYYCEEENLKKKKKCSSIYV